MTFRVQNSNAECAWNRRSFPCSVRSSIYRAGASYLAMVRPSSSTDFHTESREWRGCRNRSRVYTHAHARIISGNMGETRLAYVCGWFGSSDPTRHCRSGLAMGIVI